MKANLAPSVSLDFLDGYLFRLLEEIAAGPPEESGFLDYYVSRIKDKIGGLMEYEERLARYLLSNHMNRPVVHAGTGVGTLPCALACNGMSVTAIEGYAPRVVAAQRIRAAIANIWPDVWMRYNIVEGVYPHALSSKHWGPQAILVFTNVASSWTDDEQAAIIRSMRLFGEAILDLRLFGSVRNEERDRMNLFRRIAATAQSAQQLPDVASDVDAHFARFVFSAPS
jgi:hypothetical protein